MSHVVSFTQRIRCELGPAGIAYVLLALVNLIKIGRPMAAMRRKQLDLKDHPAAAWIIIQHVLQRGIGEELLRPNTARRQSRWAENLAAMRRWPLCARDEDGENTFQVNTNGDYAMDKTVPIDRTKSRGEPDSVDHGQDGGCVSPRESSTTRRNLLQIGAGLAAISGVARGLTAPAVAPSLSVCQRHPTLSC